MARHLVDGMKDAIVTVVFLYIINIVVAISVYLLFAYMLMLTGRKAGLKNDWQAYVPFARELYKMKMLKVPSWKMLFFGDFVSLFSAILLSVILISAFFGSAWVYILSLILIAYFVFSVILNVVYYKAFYKSFGFSGIVVLARYVLAPLAIIIDCVIALDNRIRFGSSTYASEPAPYAKAISETRPKLYGVTGDFSGSSFDLSDRDEIVLGRDPKECNIVFDQTQTSISRKHCGVRFDAITGKVVITNYSKNGVIVGSGQLPGNMSVSVDKGAEFCLGTPENKFKIV